MTFALFQLNGIEILFLLGLAGLLFGGGVLFIVFLIKGNNRSESLPQREELERLREDFERACNRVVRLEEENRQLRQVPPIPGESRFAP